MFSIKINNSYFPEGVKVKDKSLYLDEVSGKKVMGFDIIDMNSGLSFYNWTLLIGKKIELYIDGVLYFGGQLDEKETMKINEHPIIGCKIVCNDWTFLADKANVNKSYSRQLISDLFKKIIDEYLAPDGITYTGTSIQETTSQYISINCPYIKSSQVFEEVSALIGWTWKIGPDKVFYFQERAADTGAQFIENGCSYIPKSLKLDQNRNDYRNVQILQNVNALTDSIIEKATPTPDNDSSFFIRFPINEKPNIYVTDDINIIPSIDYDGYSNYYKIPGRYVGIGGLDIGLCWYYYQRLIRCNNLAIFVFMLQLFYAKN